MEISNPPNLRLHKRAYVLAAASVVLVVGSFLFVGFSHTVKATKLLVVYPTAFTDLGEPTEITIKAIDDVGNLDATRNDLVELSVRSVSYNTSMARLSATSIRLQNGVGSVYVVGDIAEVVDVTATWKDGPSHSSLQRFVCSLESVKSDSCGERSLGQ